ncbi:MAG: hypothetical protein B7Z22_03005, partial [Hyphomonas sp. 32-62-5]
MILQVILASLTMTTGTGPMHAALAATEAPETFRAAFTVELRSQDARHVYSFDPRLPKAERWQLVSRQGQDEELDAVAANWASEPAPDGRLFPDDLRACLGIPAGAGREGLGLALQTIVLAARASRVWAIDGVYNALDDAEGLAAECRHGRSLGFDGKSLIHPAQLAIAAQAFGPSEAELADARALLEAA